MTERLSKLLSVKSIVTILLTAAFTYLSVFGVISSDQFLTVYTVIVAFYFGVQHERKNSEAAK